MKFFKPEEFACKCCGELPQQKIMDLVDQIRTDFGHPISINSGKRCEKHNKEIGGATHSRHVVGDAADLSRTPELLAFLLPKLEHYGVCMEDPNVTTQWIHVDMLNRNGFKVFKP